MYCLTKARSTDRHGRSKRNSLPAFMYPSTNTSGVAREGDHHREIMNVKDASERLPREIQVEKTARPQRGCDDDAECGRFTGRI